MKKLRNILTFIYCTLGLFGCATTSLKPIELSPRAKKIKLVEYIKPQDRKNLIEIDLIKCEQLDINSIPLEEKINFCKSFIKIEAEKLNGDIVLLNPSYQAIGVGNGNNLVMRGIVFTKKQ